MPDREKVIKDLEECLSASCRGFRPRLLCPYNDEEWDIMRDALALLKEQEPIQMKISEDYGIIKFGECPKCKSFINNRYFPKSCGCGQAVKWE